VCAEQLWGIKSPELLLGTENAFTHQFSTNAYSEFLSDGAEATAPRLSPAVPPVTPGPSPGGRGEKRMCEAKTYS